MKEFYIAPEAEIICFAPVEELATSDWGWSGNPVGLSDGGNSNATVEIEIPETNHPGNGEMDP